MHTIYNNTNTKQPTVRVKVPFEKRNKDERNQGKGEIDYETELPTPFTILFEPYTQIFFSCASIMYTEREWRK